MDIKKQFEIKSVDNGKNAPRSSFLDTKVDIELITDAKKYEQVFKEMDFRKTLNSHGLNYFIPEFAVNKGLKFSNLPKKVKSLKMVNAINIIEENNLLSLILFYSKYYYKEPLSLGTFGYNGDNDIDLINKVYTEVYLFDSEYDMVENKIFPSLDIINQMDFSWFMSNFSSLNYYSVSNRDAFNYKFISDSTCIYTPYSPLKELISIL